MRLSAPIYRLKRDARLLARNKGLPLHAALDRTARNEGFQSWSHLASSSRQASPAATILSGLRAGDLLIVAARPGQGKTLLGLELAALAETVGRTGFFFTLDYHDREVADRLAELGGDRSFDANAVVVDTSDDISAGQIIHRLDEVDGPALLVVDYLQLLDQRRANPSLDHQIRSLRRYVTETGAICVILSQIDRMFDLSGKSMPDKSDIRLPNPVDLSVFDKVCFLNNGEIDIDMAA